MIEYDYTLERDEQDERRVLKPSGIPKELPNLVYIEGKNSSGKSTLLNIIALGFHGLKKDRINPALRNKMHDLVSSDHQKLQFSVRLTNEDSSVVLTAVKKSFDDREIIVRENVNGRETLLTPDLFHRKYNLMYDIPNDPTERLNQLVTEIRETQRMYCNRLGSLRNHMRSAINEIRGGRDPKRIGALRQSISKAEDERKSMTESVGSKEEFLDLVERYAFARLYVSSLSERDDASNRLKELEKRAKQSDKKSRRVNRQFQQQLTNVRTMISAMAESKKEISSMLRQLLPPKEKHHLKIWDKIDLESSLEEFTVPETLDSETLCLSRIILSISIDESSTKGLSKANVLHDLIEFLSHYRDSDVVLPGIDKTVDEFLSVLEDQYRRYEAIKVRSDYVAELMKKLETMRQYIRDANRDLAGIKVVKESCKEIGEEDFVESLDVDESKKLSNIVERITEIIGTYKIELRKKGVKEDGIEGLLEELEAREDLEPYRVYNGAQLKELMNELRREVLAGHNSIRDKKSAIDVWTSDLSKLEKMKPHKYHDRLQDLEGILNRIQLLENRIGKEYDQYISLIIDKKKGSGGAPEKLYFEEVASYLGRKVGFIRYIEAEYKVSRIDLVAGNIIAESGKRIRLTDMGTGQSQSAYLTGLLNTEDTRPIIALFDEVAAMDESSMEPIYQKFRELYKRKRLLVGIVVQKAESLRVVPKVQVCVREG